MPINFSEIDELRRALALLAAALVVKKHPDFQPNVSDVVRAADYFAKYIRTGDF